MAPRASLTFRDLLAAVALQHVHRVDGNVVSADFVLVHLRLLGTVCFRFEHYIP